MRCVVLVFISFLILSLLVGCGAPTANSITLPPTATLAPPTTTPVPASPTPRATRTPQITPTLDSRPIQTGLLKEIFPGLGQLAKVTENIHLETGLSNMALSSDFDYHLKLEHSGLSGQALFEADYYVGKYLTFQDARQINVPLDKANQFFEKLAETPLEEGPYKATERHKSDYYPFFSFDFETSWGELSFSSNSQEDDFSPWRVTFAGRNFYANNGVPFDAYNIIRPYLKTDIIDELSSQFGQSITDKWNIYPRYKSPQPVSPLKQLKEGQYTAKDEGYIYAVNPATNTVALPSYKNGPVVQLLNTNLQPVKELEEVKGPSLTQLQFSPDGKFLAGIFAFANANQDHSICVWEIASGKLLVRLVGDSRIRALAFSQDDKTLVSGSADRMVRVWSLPDGKNTLTLQGTFPEIYEFQAVAISPDGSKIAAGGLGNFGTRQFPIKVWDLKNSNAETTLLGPNVPISALAFSPDGKTLLSVDGDGGLRLWNTATWQQLAEASVDGAPGLTNVSFSPDGRKILTASQDGGMRVWDTSSLKLLSLTVAEPIQKDAYGALFQAFFTGDGQNILTYDVPGEKIVHFRLWSVN